MHYFPALRNTFTDQFFLFHDKWCRDNFKLPFPGTYEEDNRPRDDDHMQCARCAVALKITDITAKFNYRGRDEEADVVNPGDNWGKCCVVVVGESLWVVEADHEGDAVEEFVSNDRTEHILEISPEDYGDYASQVSEGDTIGGVDIEKDGWIDLNGKFYEDDPNLGEPEYGPSGELYDDENMDVWTHDRIKGIRYFGVYEDIPLPAKGVRPENFTAWRDWAEENAK